MNWRKWRLTVFWKIGPAILVLASCRLIGAQSVEASIAGAIWPVRLRCEYLDNPLGIDVVKPRLSWTLEAMTNTRGLKQSAYRVLVASTPEKLAADRGDLWDSGKVESDQQLHITYAGQQLTSRLRCHWKVRVWDQRHEASAWSEPAMWSMGLLKSSDWRGKWIADAHALKPPMAEGVKRTSPWLRKTFTLAGKPKRATVYVASIGYHELYVNGRKVSDAVLSPAVSELDRRVLYVTYEVTDLLEPGENCLALWVGQGWAAWQTYDIKHGATAIVQLEVERDGADSLVIATDATWKTHPSPITFIGSWKYGDFGGENYDATREIAGWNTTGLDDRSWQPATVIPAKPAILSAEMVQPNRKIEELRPVAIEPVEDHKFRIDMGRNYNGWLRLRVTDSGTNPVKITYSERADQAQSFNQADELIPGVDGESVFCSRFNYRTFRWATVEGLTEAPQPEDVTGFMIHTDYPATTDFSCSDDLLNRIHDTIVWTYRCLSLGGYVVDCSHRERCGYGAEGQASMECGMTHFDQAAMFTKWLRDWRDVQDPRSGSLPNTAPTRWGGGGPAWGAIVVTMPWECYLRYGDRRILYNNYAAMQGYLRWLKDRTKGGVLQVYDKSRYGYIGDWVSALGIDPAPRGQPNPHRVRQFFNNCYMIHCLQIAGRVANLLDKPDEAAGFARQAEAMKQAVHKAFFDEATHSYVLNEQTYLALPLLIGLPPEPLQSKVLDNLERNIRVVHKGHITSGVLGTYLQLKYLTRAGRGDLIHTMLSQPGRPGWGHMLAQGATTIWEYWDGIKSRNHTSFLSAGSWFVEGLGGIQPDPQAPGFKHIVIRPVVVGDLTWVKCTHRSIRGKIVSNWRREGGKLYVEVTVPPNTTATIHVPTPDPAAAIESGRPVGEDEVDGIKVLRAADNTAVFQVGSGHYVFEGPFPEF